MESVEKKERFSCPLCLSLFIEPVSLPCGHCYCMHCANKHLDHEEDSGIYSCPECRQEFVSRPLLVRNNVLAFVVDELRKAVGLDEDTFDIPEERCRSPPTPCVDSARPGDVACDVCYDFKSKAVKSCLQCMASYCEDHLQPHFDVAPLRKHKLVAPTTELENSICSKHYEVMKLFCRTDQSCICYLCSKDEHKGHEKVSAAAERNEKQKDLQGARKRIYSKIKTKEKDMEAFQQEEDSINDSVENAMAHTEKVFADLCKIIEKNLSVIKEKATSRQKAEVSRFKKLRESVHQEISELREKDRKLENLSRTDDDIGFLLNYSLLSQHEDQPSVRIRHSRHFEKVPAIVSEAKYKILDVLDKECAKIILMMSGTTAKPAASQANQETRDVPDSRESVVQTPDQILENNKDDPMSTLAALISSDDHMSTGSDQRQRNTSRSDIFSALPSVPASYPTDVTNPDVVKHNLYDILGRVNTTKKRSNLTKGRANFLQFACPITMDPSTANPHLVLSKENRKVVYTSEELTYSVVPQRFAYSWQVLSQESLTGRCYLEVERSGRGVLVAVAYKDISRAGTFRQCMFGDNEKSWALDCFKNSYEFRHNGIKTSIPGTWSSRVGVYVDHDAGVLSFFSVSDTMTLLHRVQTTFTQPLYAGLTQITDLPLPHTWGLLN
uniref:Tripartite motif containing 25 n=1 Tax=Oryzias melastigma TaxID=30732 RepID=A0A3B3CHD7_ORYME